MKKVRVYLILEVIEVFREQEFFKKLNSLEQPLLREQFVNNESKKYTQSITIYYEVNEYLNELTGETKYFKVGKCGNLEFMKTSTFLELKKQTEQSFTPDK